MTSYFFMPSIKKVSGGMMVIAQIASSLNEAGYETRLVTNGLLPSELKIPSFLSVLQLDQVKLCRDDRWIVPEGWPAFLEPGLTAKAKCAAYVQNWAFLHGLLPSNIKWKDLGVRLFSVSWPVSWFISQTTGLEAPVASPALDRAIFYPEVQKLRKKSVRIAWMPRKNKHVADQIRMIFEAFLSQSGKKLPEWIPIVNQEQKQVGEIMRSADIFLATGFPEGFGLPPLEAMACGCVVAGFSGMGGWQYMRNALPDGFEPPFSLPTVSFGPNGFYAADGDTLGAALALVAAHDAIFQGKGASVREAGLETANLFTQERQKRELLDIWENSEFWS